MLILLLLLLFKLLLFFNLITRRRGQLFQNRPRPRRAPIIASVRVPIRAQIVHAKMRKRQLFTVGPALMHVQAHPFRGRRRIGNRRRGRVHALHELLIVALRHRLVQRYRERRRLSLKRRRRAAQATPRVYHIIASLAKFGAALGRRHLDHLLLTRLQKLLIGNLIEVGLPDHDLLIIASRGEILSSL